MPLADSARYAEAFVVREARYGGQFCDCCAGWIMGGGNEATRHCQCPYWGQRPWCTRCGQCPVHCKCGMQEQLKQLAETGVCPKCQDDREVQVYAGCQGPSWVDPPEWENCDVCLCPWQPNEREEDTSDDIAF